jgi:excisionase family DNA binding protein
MLKVSQVANRLNLSQSKVYELIESGDLPHHRLGSAIRVSEEQLAAFLDSTKRERVAVTRRTARPRLRHIKL